MRSPPCGTRSPMAGAWSTICRSTAAQAAPVFAGSVVCRLRAWSVSYPAGGGHTGGMAGGGPSSAFIGRAVELGQLDATLDRAEQGRPQVVLVAGDAGVGKTRLLLAFGERALRRGMRVLAGGCVELGDIGLAYLPV